MDHHSFSESVQERIDWMFENVDYGWEEEFLELVMFKLGLFREGWTIASGSPVCPHGEVLIDGTDCGFGCEHPLVTEGYL